MSTAATEPIANVLVCERKRPHATILESNCAARHERQSANGDGLRERVRQIGYCDHAKSERNEVIQRNGDRAGQAIATHSNGHPVQQQAGERVCRGDDDP